MKFYKHGAIEMNGYTAQHNNETRAYVARRDAWIEKRLKEDAAMLKAEGISIYDYTKYLRVDYEANHERRGR